MRNQYIGGRDALLGNSCSLTWLRRCEARLYTRAEGESSSDVVLQRKMLVKKKGTSVDCGILSNKRRTAI